MPTNGPHDDDLIISPRPRRPARRLVVGLITVALLVAGATGVALAADSTSPAPSASGTPSTDQPAPDGQQPRHLGRHRLGMRGGPGMLGGVGPFGAVHGEAVVPKAGGGFQTLLMQRGTVTEVSGSSLTVKSEDGYSASYAVSPATLVNSARDGIGSVDKGAQVTVVAVKSGGEATVLRLEDLTRWQGLRKRFGGGAGRYDGGTTGSSSGTSSTQT